MFRFGLDGVGRAYRRLGTRRGRPAQHLRRTQRVEVGWGCAASMAMPLGALRRGPHASVTQALGERIRGQLSNCARGFPTRHAASPAEQLAYGCVAVDSDAQRGLLPALDCRRECWKSEPSEHAQAAAMRMTALRAIALPRDSRSSGSSGFVRETGPACCRNTAGASRQDRPNLNTAALLGQRAARCRSSAQNPPMLFQQTLPASPPQVRTYGGPRCVCR